MEEVKGSHTLGVEMLYTPRIQLGPATWKVVPVTVFTNLEHSQNYEISLSEWDGGGEFSISHTQGQTGFHEHFILYCHG